jgi:hypothetical protein
MLIHEVLVVGGGLAGLMAALTATEKSDVAVLSKIYPTRSHSGAAQGGFNAVLGEDDSIAAHIFDTVKGSDYLGDQDAIEVLCSEGPELIRELERMGVLWSRNPEGGLAQRSLGGAGFPRACFAADVSGHVVLHTLFEKVLERGVKIYPEWHLLELLVEEGQIAGALVYDLARAKLEIIRCKVVILATGGYGRAFAKTTNAYANTGDGMAIAYRAGALLSDMEFVQFHPTTLFGTNILAEHSRRGRFRPVGLELAFGPGGDLPAATFILRDGSEMTLAGRIDRIDAAEGESGIYLRVIDYKSARMTIRLCDIYHGLKLQLLAYLDVALEHALTLAGAEGLPGAVLYFRLDDPFVKTDGRVPDQAELKKRILRELRMTGLILADPEVVRLMDGEVEGDSDLVPVHIKKDGEIGARSAVLTSEQFELLRHYMRYQLASAGSEIMDGVVEISPYRLGAFRSCQHCSFKPVCQFDLLVEGNEYRLLHQERDGVIWIRLAGQGEDDKNE